MSTSFSMKGTDIYWARSRTLEYLSGVLPRLPQGVHTELGPDATGVGGFFSTPCSIRPGKQSLANCARSGLVPAIPAEVRARCCRGGAAWRLRPAVSGQRRSESPARVQHSDRRKWSRPSARATTMSAAGCVELSWRRVHGSRPRLRAVDRRSREYRADATRRRRAGPCARCGHVTLGPDLRRGDRRPGTAKATLSPESS